MPFASPFEMLTTKFEPMQNNRFALYIEGIPTFLVKTIQLPGVSRADLTVEHVNNYFKVAGKSRYGDVSLELYSSIAPNALKVISDWDNLVHEGATGRDGYSDFYKKNVVFDIWGPTGDLASQFTFFGAWPKEFTPGSFDKAGDSIVMHSLTLAIDGWVLNA